ncbi:MAG: hypothetical protein ACW972_04610 [Promethearchaeota archaeon]|jgi:hypothetical protein
MKEYKVESIKASMGVKKNAENAEELLNSMAMQGWSLKFVAGLTFIFERDK